jgi:Zn-dependent peptidase ImmA (M78 family)
MYAFEIYSFVKKLQKKFRTKDPFEIAEACNINIRYRDFNELKGMYTVIQRCPYIFLNNSLDEYMEKVVLFHELGHHFLHRHQAVSAFKEHGLYDMSSKLEIEANIFAANFIISDEDVMDNISYGYTSEQAAKALCVPHEMLLIKLKDMNSRGCKLNIPYVPKSDFLA